MPLIPGLVRNLAMGIGSSMQEEVLGFPCIGAEGSKGPGMGGTCNMSQALSVELIVCRKWQVGSLNTPD